jgi:hypothetical protein
MDNHSNRPQPPNRLPCFSSKDGDTSASPPSAACIFLPVGTITDLASIIDPYAGRASLRPSLHPSSLLDNAKLPSLQSVHFWLDNSGNDNCNFDDHDDSDKADDGGNDDEDVCNDSFLSGDLLSAGTDDNACNDSSLSVKLLLERTVILGMQLNPYNALTTAHCRKAVGQTVLDSDMIGINPDHKKWIRQSMLDNWGIRLL